MKVKNYRTFWILLAITLFSIPGVNYMLFNIFNNSKGKSILVSSFLFPDVWLKTWCFERKVPRRDKSPLNPSLRFAN